MQKILVKIHDAKQTIAETLVVTKDGTPTVIKASKRVNYEFIDQATGYAPHHIVTKRVGQDLHISLEEDAQATDLIIEGFYDAGDTALIGMAENNQYYYYIPDTGSMADYVTELAIGDIEGQALGGTAYPTPWWLGASDVNAAFVPWLVGLAGIGAAIAFGRDGKAKPAPVVDTIAPEAPVVKAMATEVTVTPASDAVSMEVTYKDRTNQDVTKTFSKDPQTGKWKDNDPNDAITIDENTGKVTIPVAVVAEKTPVTATSKDNAGNPSEKGEATTLDIPPSAPTVTADNVGDGKIDLPKDLEVGDKVIVNVPLKDGTTETVTLTKQQDGSLTSDKPAIIPNVPAGQTSITIPATELKDGGTLTATSTTADGKIGGKGEVILKDTVPEPTISVNADGISITPENKKYPTPDSPDKISGKYVNANGDTVVFEFTKDPVTDKWVDNNPSDTITINEDTGVVTIPSSELKPGSPAEAIQSFGKEESSPATAIAPNVLSASSAPKPNVDAQPDGSVIIEKTVDNATELTASYKDETGADKTVIVSKDPSTGKWVQDPSKPINDKVSVDETTGKITIPANEVKDGSLVTGTQAVPNAPQKGEGTTVVNNETGTLPVAPSPVVTNNNDGSVSVAPTTNDTPSKNATSATATYTDEAGNPQTVTATKDPVTGKWTKDPANTNDKVTVNPDTGVITIPADQVKDGSEVKGTQSTPIGDGVATSIAKDNIPEPTVKANDDGSATITPTKDATSLTVEFVDENNTLNTIKAEKQGDKWVIADPSNTPDIKINETTGEVSIPADKLKDGSEVVANQTTPQGVSGDATDRVKAFDNTDKPTVTVTPPTGQDNDSDITAKPGDDNTKVTVTFTDEDGKPQTIVTEKDPTTGEWKPTTDSTVPVSTTPTTDGKTPYIDPKTGEVTLPKDSVDNDKPVKVVGEKTGADPVTVEVKPADTPTITEKSKDPTDNDGDITAKPGDDNTKATVTFTDEDGKPQTITVIKGDHDNDPSTPDTWAVDPTKTTVVPVETTPTTDGKTPYIDPKTGEVTLPKDSVDNDKPVKVVGEKEGSTPSVEQTNPNPTKTPTVEVAHKDTDGDGVDDTTTISGKTEPNATVEIDTNGDGTPDTTVTADNNGDYTTDVKPVVPADTKVTATATVEGKDPSGKGEGTSPAVDTTPNPNPTKTPTVEVAHKDTDGDGVDDTTTISGKTEPNATVEIDTNGDGTPDTTVTADNNGDYTTDVKPVVPADTKVTATATVEGKDPSGKGEGTSPAVDTTPNPNPTKTPTVEVAHKDTDGDGVDDTTTISGKTEPNATVEIDTNGDGTPDTTVTADNNGDYTTDVKPVVPADTKVTATATVEGKDPSGKGEGTSPAVDTTPNPNPTKTPTVEVAHKDTDGDGVDDTTTISGKTEPNATVEIDTNGDGTPDTTVTADNNGDYTTDVKPVVPADTKVTATATVEGKDPSGKGEGTSPAVDTTPNPNPTKTPTVEVAHKDTDGDGVDDTTTISGKTEPNATVEIDTNGDGTPDTTVTADNNGDYTTDVKPVVPADTKVTATATVEGKDPSGKGEGTSPAVDTTPNPNPTKTPTVEVAHKDTDGDGVDDTTTISGKTEPNATVEIDTNGDGTPDTTVTADNNGDYTTDVKPVVPADTKVTATATVEGKDPSGKGEGTSPAVDTTPNPNPTKTPTVEVAHKDTDGDGVDDTTTISGKTEPNATVEIDTNGDGTPDTTVTADNNGDYTTDVKPVVPADTKVTATATVEGKDPSGKGEGTSPAVDTTPNPNPTKTPTVEVAHKDTDGDGVDDTTTISGKTEPNATVEIDTNGDGTPDTTVTADNNGDYTTDVKPVVPADTKVTATATVEGKDPSGKGEGTSPAVDTTPADTTPPTITVNIVDDAVEAGAKTTVTFTLSDDKATEITDFIESDITVTNGTLVAGSLKQDPNNKLVYTAEVTAGASTTAPLTVKVEENKFSDGTNQNAVGGEDTATVKTPTPPVASITVATTAKVDPVDSNGNIIQGAEKVDLTQEIASADGKSTIVAPAIYEDADQDTKLVYTVSLDKAPTSEITVTVELTGKADINDFDHKTANISADGKKVTLTFAAGEKSKTFEVSALKEPDSNNQFVFEGRESVIATIVDGGANYTVDSDNKVATGVIIDGNPLAVSALSADVTLFYSFDSGDTSTQKSKVVDGVVVAGTPATTTNGGDSLYVGYYPSGDGSNTYGQLSGLASQGVAGGYTDGYAQNTTIDMAGGDDTIKLRGNMLAKTRVYLGEGNDVFDMFAGTLLPSLNADAYIYAESGDDKINIRKSDMHGTIYLGEGSDTLVLGTNENFELFNGSNAYLNNLGTVNLTGTVDMGSSKAPTSDVNGSFYTTYQDGYAKGEQLGFNGVDTADQTNKLYVSGDVTGKVIGGLGTDEIYMTTYNTKISLTNLVDIDLIDLTGVGNNTLNDVTSANLANNNELYVKGNAGDRVNLGAQLGTNTSGFTKGVTHEHEGVTYDIWSDNSNGNIIYIQQGITVL